MEGWSLLFTQVRVFVLLLFNTAFVARDGGAIREKICSITAIDVGWTLWNHHTITMNIIDRGIKTVASDMCRCDSVLSIQ